MILSDNVASDRQVWLRAFYGFNPEEAGYLGFTKESQREDMIGRMRDGDLVLIYGAVQSLTQPDLRSQALGFLEIKLEKCRDLDRQNDSSMKWKVEYGFKDRWTYGIKVVRAWRIRNRVGIATIAPMAYRAENRFERTTKAILLEPAERHRALSYPVYEVGVYGEPPIGVEPLPVYTMADVLKPSRGIAPNFGHRTSQYDDGENHLYLMMLSAKAEALLGKAGPHVGKSLVKVGRSNDPRRRLKEINGGFPERAVCRWELKYSEAFADGNTAHSCETELKNEFEKRFVSQGGEFYCGDGDALQNSFRFFCASKLPKILAAPGRARGIK